MAATDSPQTLSELRTDFLNRVREATGVSSVNTMVDRYLNIGLKDMHMHKQWWWAERRSQIITKVPYSTGTVDVSQGGTAVTGTSTAWTTADSFGNNNATAGDKVTINGQDVYVVDAVGSATSMTLANRYVGSTVDDGGYTVYQDEYALASDFESPLDARLFSPERNIHLIGPKEFYLRFSRNNIRQAPQYATLLELGPSGSVTGRRRVIFGPAPDKAYMIPYRYITSNLAVTSAGATQSQLSGNTDEPIVPVRYRVAIVLNAAYHWYRDRKNDVRSQEMKAEYTDMVIRISNDHVPEIADRIRFLPLTRVGQRRVVSRRRYGSASYPNVDWFDQLR